MEQGKYQRLSAGGCGLVALASSEAIRRKQLRDYTGCDHEKPRFANGKERRFCFDCSPRPEPKPRRQYTPKQVMRAICGNQACGVEFVQTLERQRFCQPKCANTVNNRKGNARRRNSEARECRHCRKSYTPEYGSLRTYYCTLDCRRKAINLRTGGNTHRRRARKFGVSYSPVNRRKVFERDGWKCYLCGCDTPMEMSGAREDNSPELDHVVPMSRGGAHSYENTRCSCRACNLAKSDKLVTTTPVRS